MEGGEVREPPGTHIADPGKEARSASGIPVVPVFDGYRALAILGVVLLHVFTVSGVVGEGESGTLAQLNWGLFGRAVEVLFVVSGFVVFLPTVARGGRFGSWTGYAIRRAARLLPAYWLILVISLVLLATVNLEADVPMPSVLSTFTHFTGTQLPASMLSGEVSVGFFVNPPLWTLSVELGFYLVLPFIAAVYFRRPFAGLLAALLVTVAWDLFFDNYYDIISLLDIHPDAEDAFRFMFNSGAQLPAWALSFGLGMTGAWVYVKVSAMEQTEALRRRILGVLLGAVLAGAILAWVNGDYLEQTRQSLWLSMAFSVALASAMVAIALGPAAFRWPFANRPIRRLGDISYGIYLSHMLLLIYMGDLLDLPKDGTVGNLLVWMLAVLPGSILYGYLSARFLEQPVRRWARQFGNRQGSDNKAG